jgi:hypothetical protein
MKLEGESVEVNDTKFPLIDNDVTGAGAEPVVNV